LIIISRNTKLVKNYFGSPIKKPLLNCSSSGFGWC